MFSSKNWMLVIVVGLAFSFAQQVDAQSRTRTVRHRQDANEYVAPPAPKTHVARAYVPQHVRTAGIQTGVMIAPVIPGLNDAEIPTILQAARDAGALVAGFVMLRLPFAVEDVFREWLERTQSLRAERVLSRIRATRQGELSSAEFGERMVGSGEIASQINQMFRTFKHKFGLDRELPPQDCSLFQPPVPSSGQQRLF